MDLTSVSPIICCPLALLALLALIFIALFVFSNKLAGGKPSKGEYGLADVLDVELHKTARSSGVSGTADLSGDPIILKPLFSEALAIPKKSVVKVSLLKSATASNAFVFYRKDGVLCHFKIMAPPDSDFEGVFPGLAETIELGSLGFDMRMAGLIAARGGLDDYFGNPDLTPLADKQPIARYGGGSLHLADMGGKRSIPFRGIEPAESEIISRMPFVYSAYATVQLTGIFEVGIDVYKDAIKVSVPGSNGFLLPKDSITDIRRTGSKGQVNLLGYPGGITIFHKVKNAPERISFFSRDFARLADALAANGYPVE